MVGVGEIYIPGIGEWLGVFIYFAPITPKMSLLLWTERDQYSSGMSIGIENFPLIEAGLTLELLPNDKVGVRPQSLTYQQRDYIRNNKTEIIRELELEMVRGWLHKLGEPESDHFLVLDKCKADPEALAYFVKIARGEFDE